MVSTTLSLDNKTPASASESRFLISATTAAAAANSSASASSASFINSSSSVQKFDSSSSLNEKISILFPKCRPKSDINLNPMNNTTGTVTTSTHLTSSTSSNLLSALPSTAVASEIVATTTSMTSPATSSLSSSESSSAPTKSPNIGTNPFLMNAMINNSNNSGSTNVMNNRQFNEKISYYYKSKEDLNYQHQQPHVPTSLSSYSLSKFASSQKSGYYHSNPFVVKESHWEQRKRTPNTTPASTVLNSPDLTDSDSRNCYGKSGNHHIRVGRSPVNQTNMGNSSGNNSSGGGCGNGIGGGNIGNINAPDILTPTKSMAVSVADGEVVVFDDIGENWQSLRITDAQSSRLAQQSELPDRLYESLTDVARTKQNMVKIDNEYIDRNYGGGITDVSELRAMTVTDESVDNFSGIMEYDGSPRRFGHGQMNIDQTSYALTVQNSKVLSSPRPGFPQRIVMTPNDVSLQQSSSSATTQVNADDTSNDVSEIATTADLTLSSSDQQDYPQQSQHNSTFDYLYEFSETRKVLEEFFKCPTNDDKIIENGSDVDSIDIHYEFKCSNDNNKDFDKYIGQRLASSPFEEYPQNGSPKQHNGFLNQHQSMMTDNHNHSSTKDVDYFLDSASRSSGEVLDNDGKHVNRSDSRCFRYSPETTDYDSNCGDLDSLSGDYNGINNSYPSNYSKYYASMPILEDGLSSGHASDTENNNPTGISVLMNMRKPSEQLRDLRKSVSPNESEIIYNMENSASHMQSTQQSTNTTNTMTIVGIGGNNGHHYGTGKESEMTNFDDEISRDNVNNSMVHLDGGRNNTDNMLQSPKNKIFKNIDPELDSLYSINMVQLTPPPPAPAPHRKPSIISCSSPDVQAALKDIKNTLQRTKTLSSGAGGGSGMNNSDEKRSGTERVTSPAICSPVWIPRHFENSGESIESETALKNGSGDEDELDTDLETDRLLGHQRLEDHGFYDEKTWCDTRKPRSLLSTSLSKFSPKVQQTSTLNSGSLSRQGLGSLLPTTPELISANNVIANAVSAANVTPTIANIPPPPPQQQQPPTMNNNSSTSKLLEIGGSLSSPDHSDKSPEETIEMPKNNESPTGSNKSDDNKEPSADKKRKSKNKEVLIEGVLFRARYLGSTQLVCEGQPTKSTRMVQAEEAVSRIKALAPDGEVQPSTDVDLFISTEKIMVLNTDLKEIMMDHALRTISYIADIGDLVVLMARRRFVPNEIDDAPKLNRTPKMICHVFESDEAQFIAQSIGQAFQVAYMEFLKANGIEDHSFVKEMDYQEVLNSQEIFGDELEIFAKKELQKEVVVPKAKGEILGVVIVESGWGSMLPTVVIANLLSSGAAARCGQLNIGDQIIAINGMSLVGLPLSTCQNYIKNTKTQTVVKFTVVPCAPVVEVKIKRPNTKYQLGFSVQNGVICSLLRGGIAERGGVRVGHRIIEINNQSVVAVPHEKIVNLLATSVGEILMKTMPTSMFRLLTGQENPVYI